MNKSKEILTKIFTEIMPKYNMNFRKEQLTLSLKMLTALEENNIAMCEAEVGTGKTHAYILASVVHNIFAKHKKASVISTSTIALQKALVEDYLPQISRILLKEKLIATPLKYTIRKGKGHYICESKLKRYISSTKISDPILKDMLADKAVLEISRLNIKDYIKRRINICDCLNTCEFRKVCRYKKYLNDSKNQSNDFVIVNHNYFLANILHYKETNNNLLPEFGQIIIDEAHKFPSTIRDMYGKNFISTEVYELIFALSRAKKIHIKNYDELLKINDDLIAVFLNKAEGLIHLSEKEERLVNKMSKKLKSVLSHFKTMEQNRNNTKLKNEFEKLISKLDELKLSKQYIISKESLKNGFEITFLSIKLKAKINKDIWNLRMPTIMTSGTISVGGDFSHIENSLGLESQTDRLIKSKTYSPYNFSRQAMLYLPRNLPHPQSENYADNITNIIEKLIKTTHGHTLILFTSYKMMDRVYHEIGKRDLNFPLFIMRRNDTTALDNYKKSVNGVLFASDSAGEGIDIAGDVLSSLIVVKLPFPIPTAISEHERIKKNNIENFINEDIVPNMIIKLRQWIGRGIRHEDDSCVFSILDSRASSRYRNVIVSALPNMRITEKLQEVNGFIKTKKSEEYFI